MDVPYDVAISFLSGDEPLAIKIYNDLRESLRVFVYSKRQEELAGTDGLESFRKIFFSDSRLVVVLYREGWGKTKWTAVEELAIKDRMFGGGWDALLFVMLDEKSTHPTWLPTTHIRLSYAHYRDALTGAIKMRAQELGSALKVETAIEKGIRVQSNELVWAERDRLLTNNGMDAVKKEYSALCQQLDEKIAALQSHLTTIKLERGADSREYVIRSEKASLGFYLYTTAPVTQSRIVVREFDAPLILPGSRNMYLPGEGPHEISKKEFSFDYHEAYGWCWKARSSTDNLMPTSSLAEYLIKRLFELHEEFKTGERVRHRRTGRSHDCGSLGWMK
jgi:hypothetical protein